MASENKKTITFEKAIDFISGLVNAIKYGGAYTVELGPYASSVKLTSGAAASSATLKKALIVGGVAVGAVLLLVLLKD